MGPCFRRDDKRDTPPHSRGVKTPELCQQPPSREGAGNAGCALHPQSRVQKVKSTRGSHHEFTGTARHSPRNGFNGLLRALPGDRACCHRRLWIKARLCPVGQKTTSADLTPASRRQDHTTSPSAKASFV